MPDADQCRSIPLNSSQGRSMPDQAEFIPHGDQCRINVSLSGIDLALSALIGIDRHLLVLREISDQWQDFDRH